MDVVDTADVRIQGDALQARIDGAWRDHIVTSLRNPGFVAPDGW